jgi:hypothetical protein
MTLPPSSLSDEALRQRLRRHFIASARLYIAFFLLDIVLALLNFTSAALLILRLGSFDSAPYEVAAGAVALVAIGGGLLVLYYAGRAFSSYLTARSHARKLTEGAI